ncbi:hypothetical protein CEXT_301401 [Caerostris extrusa]|uniref:Uncharacterized protein n=1 Tax=Caerostris extrusa TaxID=172846 RepID=A0AAV4WSY4_CAEEX|nr:hypothetical protein CEXT_301401 [Caerostris extrusa]
MLTTSISDSLICGNNSLNSTKKLIPPPFQVPYLFRDSITPLLRESHKYQRVTPPSKRSNVTPGTWVRHLIPENSSPSALQNELFCGELKTSFCKWSWHNGRPSSQITQCRMSPEGPLGPGPHQNGLSH